MLEKRRGEIILCKENDIVSKGNKVSESIHLSRDYKFTDSLSKRSTFSSPNKGEKRGISFH